MSLTYQMPQPESFNSLTVVGEKVTALDAFESALNAGVSFEALAETHGLEETDQIVKLHELTALKSGVTEQEIENLDPTLSPALRVSKLITLCEFKRGDCAAERFEQLKDQHAPDIVGKPYHYENIPPASEADSRYIRGLRHYIKGRLLGLEINEDVAYSIVLKLSEIVTNLKQEHPEKGGRLWIGRTALDETIIVTEGEPLPLNIVRLNKNKDRVYDSAEHGRGGIVMEADGGKYGKFVIDKDTKGNPTAYQTWCTTPNNPANLDT